MRRNVIFVTVMAWGGLSCTAMAAGWSPGPSVSPAAGPLIPTVAKVPGKEFTDRPDKDQLGLADPDQVLAFDGFGGTADGFDFSGTLLPYQLSADNQIDGLAAPLDALYAAVIGDNAALTFSVSGHASIWVEPVFAAGGAAAAFEWATPAQIDRNGVNDLDALELWGSNASPRDDALRFSIEGDPFAAIPGAAPQKVAIWSFDQVTATSAPHTFTTSLAAAMDLQFIGSGFGGPLWAQLVELMDVDAIMVLDEQVLFSIAPLDLRPLGLPLFDGGEIFVYQNAALPTQFLSHGGHLWDTAFDVALTFGLPSEDVNALEAVAFVPEPATLGLLAGAGLLLIRRRDRT